MPTGRTRGWRRRVRRPLPGRCRVFSPTAPNGSAGRLRLLHRRGFVLGLTAVGSHLVSHAPQVKVLGPNHLAVLEGLTGSLQGGEALAHHPARGALLPVEHLVEAQAAAPLALLGEIAVILRTVDPEQPTVLIHEMAVAPVADAGHGAGSLRLSHLVAAAGPDPPPQRRPQAWLMGLSTWISGAEQWPRPPLPPP